jgi:hypothetical protein
MARKIISGVVDSRTWWLYRKHLLLRMRITKNKTEVIHQGFNI